MDCRKYSHSASAPRTFQDVHFPHTLHELSPTIVSWMGTARLRRLAASRLFSSAASVMTHGICLGGERNDRRSPASCGGKQPMIPHELKHGRRNQGRKFCDKLQRLEHNMRRAAAPGMPDTVQHPAVRQDRQTLGGHGRTSRIAAEISQLAAGFGRNADVSMQAFLF